MNEPWWAIAAGGAIGALLRAGLVRLSWKSGDAGPPPALPSDPALGILLANTLGCALIGAWVGTGTVSEPARPDGMNALIVIGLCGGLTTFSTLCADALRFARTRSWSIALAYLLLTAVLGFAAFGWGTTHPI